MAFIFAFIAAYWPASGSEDIELGVLTGSEVRGARDLDFEKIRAVVEYGDLTVIDTSVKAKEIRMAAKVRAKSKNSKREPAR